MRAPRVLPAILIIVLAAAAGTRSQTAGGLDPHVNPALMPGGCLACHRGHGAALSPMLAQPQRALCLSCHGTRADLDARVRNGDVAPDARPPLLSSALSQSFAHHLTEHAFSRHEPGAVTCTSCHSPHRGMREERSGPAAPGRRRLSPADPALLEYQTCEACHGSRGAATGSLDDISRLLNPGNRSYHPVEAPARDASPSVIATLAGREINCTDCHGNSDRAGAAGPHASAEPFILRSGYVTLDGSPESERAYALCYGCHQRERVLASRVFPQHRSHVVVAQASCATCHNAHGSVGNRALIRFAEETVLTGVGPSTQTGRLAFVSDGPGSGSCYLTCHGRDHAPESYGLASGRPPVAKPLSLLPLR